MWTFSFSLGVGGRKIFKIAWFFKTIILITNNAMLSSELNILSHNYSKWSDLEHSFTNRGCFCETVVLSTNNPLLSSKLNVLSLNSIPSGHIWKIPSQTGVIFSRQSFWVPALCYLHWTFYPITPFQVVRFENSFTYRVLFFFQDNCLSTNNPMLSSKLNILSHNSITNGQIWKSPSKTGVVFFRWVPTTLCYLRNCSFCPIFLFILILFLLCLHKPYFLLFKCNFLIALNENLELIVCK